MKRTAGILMPISSLPSPYGIGTFGKSAYEFADFLKSAGQKYWQVLPLGPTSYGDSPYQSFSTFAGNPYFIDLDELIADGLLTAKDVADKNGKKWGDNPRYVDYEKIYNNRFKVLSIAKKNGWERDAKEVKNFVKENAWVEDYAFYMAIKRHFGMKSWTDWADDDIRFRKPAAMKKYKTLVKEDIELFTYIQYLFFKQWTALKTYCNSNGIDIIGDIPIYVAMDSSDVWANPKLFMLDKKNMPIEVAGVPPDYFSATGQLWGNPLYDYDEMKKDGYSWWMKRIEGAGKLYDVIRIDHFRGFESFWAVPYGDDTAINGRWVKGPDFELIGLFKKNFKNLEFIAEDLGFLTPEVIRMVKKSGFPGMKILEFAFNSKESSDYRPHTYTNNCVCYTGTHDNDTVLGWEKSTSRASRAFAKNYLKYSKAEGAAWGMIRGGLSSVANLFVAQMQDYLELGAEHRMNTPGTLGTNWQWRMLDGEASAELAERIYDISTLYDRVPKELLKKTAHKGKNKS